MPKAQPTLLNGDTGEVTDVKQYPFPVRGEPITLLVDGEEAQARMTTWKDLKYTYFRVGEGQYFVAGHLSDAPAYTLQFPEGFVPTQFKKDRDAMAARAKELKGEKVAAAPVEGEVAATAEVDQPAAVEAAPKKKGRKVVAAEPVAAGEVAE